MVTKIVIATNNEESGIGNKAAEQIRETLCNYFNPDNLHILLPKAKDFLDMDVKETSEWLNQYKIIIERNPRH